MTYEDFIQEFIEDDEPEFYIDDREHYLVQVNNNRDSCRDDAEVTLSYQDDDYNLTEICSTTVYKTNRGLSDLYDRLTQEVRTSREMACLLD